MTSSDPPINALTASYTSPHASHASTSPLPSLASANESTSAKTAYITDLREKTSQLQDDVNAYLTQRMEEDKAREGNVVGKRSKSAKEEERLEEMYGEEDMEADG